MTEHLKRKETQTYKAFMRCTKNETLLFIDHGFFFFQPAPIKQEEKENIALKMTASHSTESLFRKSLESHKTIRHEQM